MVCPDELPSCPDDELAPPELDCMAPPLELPPPEPESAPPLPVGVPELLDPQAAPSNTSAAPKGIARELRRLDRAMNTTRLSAKRTAFMVSSVSAGAFAGRHGWRIRVVLRVRARPGSLQAAVTNRATTGSGSGVTTKIRRRHQEPARPCPPPQGRFAPRPVVALCVRPVALPPTLRSARTDTSKYIATQAGH